MPRKQRTDGKPPKTRRLDLKQKAAAIEAGLQDRTRTEQDAHYGPLPCRLNKDVLYQMARTMLSYDKLAQIFGCSSDHIQKHYGELVKKARADRVHALSEAQLTAAINDRNPTMLIWLGKQYLGQKDRHELTGEDGKPIQHSVTGQVLHQHQVVAYIPDNGRDTPAPNPRLKLVAGGDATGAIEPPQEEV